MRGGHRVPGVAQVVEVQFRQADRSPGAIPDLAEVRPAQPPGASSRSRRTTPSRYEHLFMQFSSPSSDIQRHAATLRRCLLSSGFESGERVSPECPYPGLAAFQPGDAERFFGREQLTATLSARAGDLLGTYDYSDRTSCGRSGLKFWATCVAGGM